MEKNIYAIVIENRKYRFEGENTDDYHIERLIDDFNLGKIIEEKLTFYSDSRDFLIVTNDELLLNKYYFALNIDDIKFLCYIDELDKYKVRISRNHFRLHKDIFPYLMKVLTGKNISASMTWKHEKIYPWENSSSYEFIDHFDEWVLDKEFFYLKSPSRYKKSVEIDEILSFENIKTAQLQKLNSIFNIDILQIQNNPDKSIYWQSRNDFLRYYDRVSSKRFYIRKELLDQLKSEQHLILQIVTNLDNNLYIEYHAVGIYDDASNYDNDNFVDNRNDEQPRYDKYNGAYGFDDNTIDSAFEGDSENYWNID